MATQKRSKQHYGFAKVTDHAVIDHGPAVQTGMTGNPNESLK